ncbi:MAG: type II CAAX prenyl endopeptidase Rce1 family protein [Promethearchaeota archaeon]
MSEKNDNIVKYCVYCGANVGKEQVYCPNCGKLIIEIKPSKESISHEHRVERSIPTKTSGISRKCPNCGSIITSTVLEQCPICSTLLEPIPESQKIRPAKTGFVFTREKLEPELRYVLKKDVWNLREGMNVFTNSILVYITAYLFLLMFVWFQLGLSEGSSTTEIPFYLILLSQIPGMLLGVFPLWYISANKHSFEKLGFPSDNKKILLALIVGILGCLGLLTINIFSNFINIIFYEVGLNFFDIQQYMEMETRAIRSGGIWVILLLLELIITSISVEILFRGVLHNTLKEKFGAEEVNGRIITILVVALVYSLIYLLFSFPIGIFFLVSNFLIFMFLGFLYELNGNIYNTIFASIFYDIVLIILILYL